ncbi:ABC transporter permease [Sulfuriferula sp. AH1]|nr:ABC transporter permease [Sulfuriferula sp. AH1]
MQTAELSNYGKAPHDAANTLEPALMPANDQGSVIATQPDMPIPQTGPGQAVWRQTAGTIRRNLGSAVLALASIALFIAAWYLAVKYRLDFYIRFTNIPAPQDVFSELLRLGKSDSFYSNMLISLRRILLGFSVAMAMGIALGLIIGRYRLARQLMFPVLEILRPIPAIAWVPIAIMLWPTNEGSIVFITFLGSFFPILLSTVHGVTSIDPVLIRAARCLGAKEPALLRQIILPATLPQIFNGLSVGMGVAWVSLIAAEMISGQFGIGYFTWEAYSLIQYADIVIGMIVIGFLGLACSTAIRWAGRLIMPWANQNGSNRA